MSAQRRRRGRHAKSTRLGELGREAKTTRDAMITLAGGLGPAGTPDPAGDPAPAGGRTGTTTRQGTPGDRAAMAIAALAALAAAVAVLVFWGGPKPATPTSAAKSAATKSAGAGARSTSPRTAPMAPLATAPGAAAGDADADLGAIAYYKEKDPRDKVAKHVDEVRWSGRYLRVYTDLKEGDTHSRVALDLCEWTSEYLTDRRGDRDPVVFVHAKKNDNGNVVLVSKLSAKDPCKSVETL